MDPRKAITARTPAPAHSSSPSPETSEDEWQHDKEEKEKAELDFFCQMESEYGIAGPSEGLEDVVLGLSGGDPDTGLNADSNLGSPTPEEAEDERERSCKLTDLLHFTAEEMSAAPWIETLPDMSSSDGSVQDSPWSPKSSAAAEPTAPPQPAAMFDLSFPKKSKLPLPGATGLRTQVPETVRADSTRGSDRGRGLSKTSRTVAEVHNAGKNRISYPTPDYSKVEPRVRFPKGGYVPPKSRHSFKRESAEPSLVVQSPAGRDVSLNTAGESPAPSDPRGPPSSAPHPVEPKECRSRPQDNLDYRVLQEMHIKTLVQLAEAQTTIDELRLKATVNLYSDPPKPGYLLQSGLAKKASKVLVLDLAHAQRAEISSASAQLAEDSRHQGSHSAESHSAESHSAESHSAGSHSAGSHSAGSHSAESHSAESHSAGSHSAESHSAESHSAESHSAESHSAGSHSAESHSAESHSAGSHSAESHSAESHSAGSHSAGSHSAGSHSAGSHSAGSHSAESHSAESHSAESHSAGSPCRRGPDPQVGQQLTPLFSQAETLLQKSPAEPPPVHEGDAADGGRSSPRKADHLDPPPVVPIKHWSSSSSPPVPSPPVPSPPVPSPPVPSPPVPSPPVPSPPVPSPPVPSPPVPSPPAPRSRRALMRSHSSSLSSLGEISASERRKSKLQIHRLLSQDGIISPDMDSGFVGSESSPLTPAATITPVHQGEPKRVSVPQEGNSGEHPTGPVTAPSPGSSLLQSQASVQKEGGSQLGPDLPRRSRQGQRRRRFSSSLQPQICQLDQGRAGTGIESDRSVYEDRLNARSISSPSSSSSLPAAGHHRDMSLLAPSPCQVGDPSVTFQTLRAQLSTLEEKLDRSLKNQKSERDGSRERRDRATADDAGESLARQATKETPTLAHRRRRPQLDVCGGSREPAHSSHCHHCLLHQCPKQNRRPVPDCHRLSHSTNHTSPTAQTPPGDASCRNFSTAAPPAPPQGITLSNPPILLYPLPLYYAVSSERSPSSGGRGGEEVRARRTQWPLDDRQLCLDTSLDRAIRAARRMRSTSRHMVDVLAEGLHDLKQYSSV
ncbi:uncharacterized protein LOC141795175 [Halichoeres trimaculatus]|uniref:uncharacterized protein LOC141795175 n=1 Tax=Halichoeres trimaculatus TaxID=147232 RepID=UPI003D9E0C72